jgi:hypothetical protein
MGIRVKWLGVAAAILLAVGAAPTTASATSGPPGTTAFYASGVTLTTSTGLKVLFYLQTEEADNSIDIFGLRASGGGWENHDWAIYTPHHTFATYDRTAGSGSIDASLHDLSGFGTLHLSFTQTAAWTTTQCDSGSTSDAPLSFTGTLFFRTYSSGRHPWGHAGTAAHPADFTSTGTASRFNGCTDEPPFACSPGVIWQRGRLIGQPIALNGRRVPTIDASHYLAQVHGMTTVQRLDDILAQVAKPAFSRDASGGLHVKLTGLPHTRVRGVARLTTTRPGQATTRSCLPKPNTETDRTWQSVAYRNGRHPLTVRSDIGHDITVRNANTATLSRTRVN